MSHDLPSSWTRKKIGDLCDVSRGASPRPIYDQRYFEGGTIPWIKIADATKSGKYLYVTKQYVNEYGASFSKILPRGTILVAASGTIGYTQILGIEGCAHDGWLILQNLRDFDRDYAYYILQLMEQHFYNSAYGAAIQNINTTILRETEIPYPPLHTQRKIAAILSAYDDLIENNNRRIKILEEMAQSIYREWFVYYHFPGHENIRMVDSGTELGEVPEGWEVKIIGDFGEVITGKTPSKLISKYWDSPDVPFIRTPDMHNQLFCLRTTDNLSYAGVNSQRNKNLPPNSLCVSCIGTVGVVTITGKSAQTNQQINSIVLMNSFDLEFLYYSLLNLRETIQLFGSAGATMSNLSRSKFMALEVITPSKELRIKYHDATSSMFSKIKNLQQKNSNLEITRNLLLPKLISGELDVSELEIAVHE